MAHGLCAAVLLLVSPLLFADGAPVLETVPLTGAYTAHHVADRDHISIIELAGNYDEKLDNGSSNLEPRAVIAREFFRTHPDEYDFLVAFSTFEYNTGEALAFHWGVQNKVLGIGTPLYDNTAFFGSQGKLQGFIDMAALTRYATDPLNPDFERVLSTLAHEMLHQWAAGVRFKEADGNLSSALLGKDNAHWSFLLNSNASVEYGNLWKDNGDGTFTSTGTRKFYSPLDLYLMGFYKPEEVPPFYLIENPAIDKTRLPEENVTISGTQRWITIEDVIAAEGPRIPAAGEAQRDFRIGFVLLTGPGQNITDAQIAALNNIRTAYMTRFAVLTGGRGAAQIYPEAMPTVTAGTPTTVNGDALRTEPASLDAAFAWLRGQQKPEGHWLDKATTDVRDTTLTLQALTKLDPDFGNAAASLSWLNQKPSRNTDYLARYAIALRDIGSDASALRTQLASRQNSDGGFGIAPGYRSDPLDTALALQALAGSSEISAAKLDTAVQYLLGKQNSDGGFSPAEGGPSRTSVTAAALSALKAMNKHATVAPTALAFLSAKQNPDGGFGDSPSTVHDTANALQTFMAFDAIEQIRSDNAATFLLGRQTVSGSWEGSVYSTASAVMALKRFKYPNWAVTSVAAEPASVNDGDRVKLSVRLRNDSNMAAPLGALRIYDGDPAQGGVVIGDDITVPAMAAGSELSFSPLWDTLDKAGAHTLYAQVDPGNSQPEMSERDNRGSVAVTVLPAPPGIDLEISDPDITIMPGSPIELPITLGIAAQVRNMGMTDATNIKVRLWEGAVGTGRLVSETVVDVQARSTLAVDFVDVLKKAGTTTYYVQIDPDNTLSEASETNNIARASVTTSPSVDLEVKVSDIVVSKNPAIVGGDVTFTVTLHNRGTIATPSTTARYYITDGNTTTELLTNTIQIAEGAEITQQIVWRADHADSYTFTVQLDGANQVSEIDEANNIASYSIAAGAPSGINLVVNYSDITFNPNPGAQSQSLAIGALVRNSGTTEATNVEVAFYQGDPLQGGVRIGDLQTLPLLAAGASQQVSLVWPQVNLYGNQLIYVVLDPEDKLTEFTEEDNRAFSIVKLLSLPDLAVGAGDVVINPGAPRTGDPIGMSVHVNNLGEQSVTNAKVRIYEGTPDARGALLAEQTVDTIAGNSSADVTLTFTLQNSGVHSLYVQVDPDNAILESSENNNIALASFTVQDADLYITEPYFSPNGDSVKDTTSLYFRLSEKGTITIDVINPNGNVVRTFKGQELTDVTNGSIEWDGRDGKGRVVPDGGYTLRVATSTGTIVGEVTADVDTNRSSLLDAAGTKYGIVSYISCSMNYVGSAIFDPVITNDDKWVYYNVAPWNAVGGVYRASINSGDEEAVIPPSWLGSSRKIKWSGASGDGRTVAFVVENTSYPYTQTLWLSDGDGKNIRAVSGAVPGKFWLGHGRPAMAQNGAYVIIPANNITLYSTDGVTPARILASTTAYGTHEYLQIRISPDSKKILAYENHDYSPVKLLLIDIDTGVTKEIAKVTDPYLVDYYYPSFRYSWSPDGNYFAITNSVTRKILIYDREGVLHNEFQWVEAPVDDPLWSDIGYVENDPQWSSSGLDLAFSDSQEEGVYHVDLGEFTIRNFSANSNDSRMKMYWVSGQRIILNVGDYYANADFTFVDDNYNRHAIDGISIDNWSSGYYHWRLDDEGYLQFSQSGRALLYLTNTPSSKCPSSRTKQAVLQSLLNMVTDLRTVKDAKTAGIQLQGTASDKNFANYTLDYASTDTPTQWSPVAPASNQPVIDGNFTTWVPPSAGSYNVRLTVSDLAGNRRSYIQRVISPETPQISDLYRSPEVFSPNGDGVFDSMLIHYRVMQPTHVDINIYNSASELVRQITRSHSIIGEEINVEWDGRNEQGIVVPDGRYRITVHKYELTVEVDNTPPEVTISLADAYGMLSINYQNYVYIGPGLTWSVKEPHYKAGALSSNNKLAVPSWYNFKTLDANLSADGTLQSQSLTIQQFSGHQYAIEAEDLAGNRATASTPVANEGLYMFAIGAFESNTLSYVSYAPLTNDTNSSDPLRFPGALIAFDVAETVHQDLLSVAVQYREIDEAEWHEDPISDTSAMIPVAPSDSNNQPLDYLYQSQKPMTPDELTFVWDSRTLTGGKTYSVRIKGIGRDGTTYLSNVVSIDKNETIEISEIKALSTKASVSATQLVTEPLQTVDIFLMSVSDLRYTTAVKIDSAQYPNTNFFYSINNLVPCTNYSAYLNGVTDSGRAITSEVSYFKTSCISVEAKVQAEWAEECDQPSPQHVQITLTPNSGDTLPLKLLTLAKQTDQGEDIIFNVNQPVPGMRYIYDMDTSQMVEGTQRLVARVVNTANQESVTQFDAIIDHTPAHVAITYPENGQKLCGRKLTMPDASVRNVLDLSGTATDNYGFDYYVEWGYGSSPADWNFVMAKGIDTNEYGNIKRFNLTNQQGNLAIVGETNEISGEITTRVHTFDWSGAHQCMLTTATIDGKVEATQPQVDVNLISPNSDGYSDQAIVSYSVDEPVQIDIYVYKAVHYTDGTFDIVGSPLRNLATGLQLVGGPGQIIWDGYADGHQPVADGWYGVAVKYVDGCGNEITKSAYVEVDNTVPDVVVSYPKTGDPLTMLVEVVGTVTDKNFTGYTVSYGIGTDPQTWAPIQSGTSTINDSVLVKWTTYGLSGDMVLRVEATDRAGNQAEVKVPLTLTERAIIINYLAAQPDLLSPNNDGVSDFSALQVGVDIDAYLTISVLDANNAVIRTIAQNVIRNIGVHTFTWDGKTDNGSVVPDGSYGVLIRANSVLNTAVAQEERTTLYVDNTPPTVTFTNPLTDFAKSVGYVTGSVTDLHLRDFSVEITSSPDSPAWSMLSQGNDSQLPFNFASLQELEEGDYAVRITAKDLAGNTTDNTVSFAVDNTKPVVAISAPADGSYLGTQVTPVAVSGLIDEKYLNIYSVKLGSGVAPQTWTTVSSGRIIPSNGVFGNLDLSKFTDGTYTLALNAEDFSGNTGENRIQVIIDNTAPTVVVTSPTANSYITNPVDITGTVSDANLTEYTLEIAPGTLANAARWSTVGTKALPVSSGTLFTLNALPPDGPQTMRVTAKDKSANLTQVVVEVIVDTQPPANPTGLVAVVENVRDIHLNWNANSEGDLAGYAVYRDDVRINSVLVTAPEYLDANVSDGRHVYKVVAVDHAGWESAPSDPVDGTVDVTPPQVSIQSPASGSYVSGLVNVVGTAYSSNDFKEYRVYVGAGATPASWQLLGRTTVSIQSDTLAQWDTFILTEGMSYTIKLEAEDVTGNISSAKTTVVIDNLAPATPINLHATATDSNVTVSWDANTESDLYGYLLFRDGHIINTSGPVIGDLKAYSLKTTQYADNALPDGSYSYTLVAIDNSGNMSAATSEVSVTIDTHAPEATIVKPLDGSSIEKSAYILATTPDTDVVSVQFQYKSASDVDWIIVGSIDVSAPYEANLDLSEQPYGDYLLRAVATDLSGKTDATPPTITIHHTDLTAPDVVSGVTALSNAGIVSITWQPRSEADLAGYNIYRRFNNGTAVLITPDLVTSPSHTDPETTTSQTTIDPKLIDPRLPPPSQPSVTPLSDGTYYYIVTAVDIYGNESLASVEGETYVFTPSLSQPVSPTQEVTLQVNGSSPYMGTVVGSVTSPTSSVASQSVMTDLTGNFSFNISLEEGISTVSAVVTDGFGNISKVGSTSVTQAKAPSQPTGLQASVNNYDVSLRWDANPETNLIGYEVYRDGSLLNSDSKVTGATATASSSQYYYYASYALDGKSSTSWSPYISYYDTMYGQWLAVKWNNPQPITQVNIEWGGEQYRAIDYDIEIWSTQTGSWQQVATVLDNVSANNIIRLDQPYRTTQVRLVLRRVNNYSYTGVRLAEFAPMARQYVATPAYTDTTNDGDHQYTVAAVNTFGFVSIPSEPVIVTVGDVTPPEPVVLDANSFGNDITLTWSQSSSPDVARYDIYRNGIKLAESTDLSNTSYIDASVSNGSYSYFIKAVDAVGNQSEPSNGVTAVVAISVPPAPQGVSVSVVPEGEALKLHWDAVADTPAAATYRVMRSEVASGAYTVVGETSGIEFMDGGLTNGVTYYYIVISVDQYGNTSTQSNEVSGTPSDSVLPNVPYIYYPTSTGIPYLTQSSLINIYGAAEPGSSVSVYRDGQVIGQAIAQADDFVEKDIVSASLFGGGFNYTSYSVSPDGKYLIGGGGYYTDIYTINPDGTNPSGMILSDIGLVFSGYSDLLTWANEASTYVTNGTDWTTYNSYIYTYSLSDGVTARLTDPAVSNIPVGVLSPDGKNLAALGVKDNQTALYKVDISSGSYTPLVELGDWSTEIDRFSLRWSADNRHIAYIRTKSGRILEIADTLTGNISTIETMLGSSRPVWSPDGKAVAYTSTSSGSEQVVIYSLQSGTSQTVTSGADSNITPQWNQDGKSIIYVKAGNALVLRDLSTAKETTLTSNSWLSNGLLDGGKSGYLLTKVNDSTLRLLSLSGRFALNQIQLKGGEQIFASTAKDASGNISQMSSGVSVTLSMANRADLAVSTSDITVLPGSPLTNEATRVAVTVNNMGPVVSIPVPVSIYAISPSGDSVTLVSGTINELNFGDSHTFTVDWTVGNESGKYSIVVIIDPYNEMTEVNEANNFAVREITATNGIDPFLSLDIASDAIGSNEQLSGLVDVLNGGSAITGSLELAIEDQAGYLVQKLPITPISLASGETISVPVTWQPGTTFAGQYQISAHLLNDQGTVLVQLTKPFTLTATSEFTAQVITDHTSYGANSDVVVNGQATYQSGNTLVSDARLHLTLLDAGGLVVSEKTELLGDLMPGAESAITMTWNTGLAVGSYTAQLKVESGKTILTQAQSTFAVVNSGPLLKGTLLLSDASPAPGTAQQVTYTIMNNGNGSAMAQPIRVVLADASGTVITSETRQLDVAAGGQESGSVSFATAGLALAQYQVLLQAESSVPGSNTTLASAGFTLVDRSAPAIAINAPIMDGYFTSTAQSIVYSRDELSNINLVEIRLDGATWLPAPVYNASQSLYASALPLMQEGVHHLEARATDTYGNTALAGPITFIVDNTPPLITITGVANDALYNYDVAAKVTISDTNIVENNVSLNGSTYSGALLSVEGDYHLAAQGRDAAGNTAQTTLWFAIDKTAPTITIAGVEEGGLYQTSVTPIVTISDPHLQTESVTLNGEPFAVGSTIGTDGLYTLAATATDGASNTSTASVTFEIDMTPPAAPVVTYPAEGETVNDRFVDIVGMSEPNATIYLVHNNTEVAVFTDASGAFHFPQVSFNEGLNAFAVYAKDRAGNIGASTTVSFTVVTAELTGSVQAPTGVLVFLPSKQATEKTAMQLLIESALDTRMQDYLVVRDEMAFVSALRTNRYGVVLMTEMHPDCDNDCSGPVAQMKLSNQTAYELRASIAAGMGLVWIKPDSDANEHFSDVLGAKMRGLLPAPNQVTLETSPASDAGQWDISGVALNVKSEGGTVVGQLAPYNAPALVLNTYGNGPVALVTFDPAALTNAQAAQDILDDLVSYATPLKRALVPGGLAEIRFRAAKLHAPVSVRFDELVTSPITLEQAIDGTITSPIAATWTRALLSSETEFASLVRLPKESGSYETTGTLFELREGSPLLLKSHTLEVILSVDRDVLAANAMDALIAFEVEHQYISSRDQAIELVHEAIMLPQTSKADLEKTMALLLDAVKKLQAIPESAVVIGEIGRLLQSYQLAWK